MIWGQLAQSKLWNKAEKGAVLGSSLNFALHCRKIKVLDVVLQIQVKIVLCGFSSTGLKFEMDFPLHLTLIFCKYSLSSTVCQELSQAIVKTQSSCSSGDYNQFIPTTRAVPCCKIFIYHRLFRGCYLSFRHTFNP